MNAPREVGVRIKIGADGLENVGRLTGELDNAGVETEQLNARAKALAAELERLGKEQGLIDQFARTKTAVTAAGEAMEGAKTKAQQLGREIAATEAPTKAQTAAFDKARAAAREADAAYQAQRLELQQLRGQLTAAGISSDQLAAAQVRVRADMAAARQEVVSLTAQVQAQVSAYRSQGEAAAAAGAKQQAAARSAADGVADVGRQLQTLQNLAGLALGGTVFGGLLKGAAETADAYANLGARIKLVTGEGKAFDEAFEGVYQIALRTNSSLESTGTLFARIAQAGKEIGVSQADALKLTESINQAIQLSGGSAESADAAITQLIQGLQSGVLRGEEFNSIMEQAPRLAQALATGLGVTTGELRKMAEAGQLTSETVIKALQGQADVLKGEFATLPATVGRAVQNLRTEWEKLVGTFGQSSGATALVAEGINKIAANLDTIARLATEAGAALLVALAIKGATALRAIAAEAGVAVLSMQALSLSIAKIPTIVNIAIAVTGFEVGFQLGEMLRENSAYARQVGVNVTQFFVGLVNELRFLKEAAAAIFTDDTIDGAFARYEARAEQQREIFKQLYEDAEKSPAQIRRATEEASASAAKLGDQAVASGGQISSAAAGAAGSVGGIGKAADEAQAAIAKLAADAGVKLPALGATATQQAAAFAELAGKSGKVLDALSKDLPAAIDKLSGQDLERFRSAFAGAFEASITQSRRLAEQLAAAGESGKAALAAAEAKGRLLQFVLGEVGKQAAQSLGVDVAGVATGLSSEFRQAEDNLAILIRSMPALRAAGIDAGAAVGQALAKMIEGAKSQAELGALRARIEALGTSGRLSGDQVVGALHAIGDRATKLRDQLDDLAPGIQGLGEAARKAGVDIGTLTTGVSKGFDDSVKVVRDLREQIEKAGIDAERASPVLARALDQRITAAATKEELKLLRVEIEKAAAAGLLLGTASTAALEKIRLKALELTPAFQQAQKDAERLGITLRDKINEGARGGVEGALTAYERLKAGGRASQDEIQQGFARTAQEAIQASGGIVPEWVKVEAAARGVVVELDAGGNAFTRLAQAGEFAGQVIIKSLDAQAAATVRLIDAMVRANEARNATVKSVLGSSDDVLDASGKVVGKVGSTVFGGKKVDVPKDAVFDQQAFDRDQANVLPGGRAPDPANYYKAPSGNSGISDTTAARLKAIDDARSAKEEAAANLLASLIAGGGFKTQPGGAQAKPSAVSTSHTVSLTFNGKTATVDATSADGASAFVKSLSAAARSAGFTA